MFDYCVLCLIMFPRVKTSQDGSTAITYAYGNFNCLKLLIASGGDINVKDNVSDTLVSDDIIGFTFTCILSYFLNLSVISIC